MSRVDDIKREIDLRQMATGKRPTSIRIGPGLSRQLLEEALAETIKTRKVDTIFGIPAVVDPRLPPLGFYVKDEAP